MSSTLASADSKTLSIGYVDGWSDSVATTHMAAEVIKAKLGYDVKTASRCHRDHVAGRGHRQA